MVKLHYCNYMMNSLINPTFEYLGVSHSWASFIDCPIKFSNGTFRKCAIVGLPLMM